MKNLRVFEKNKFREPISYLQRIFLRLYLKFSHRFISKNIILNRFFYLYIFFTILNLLILFFTDNIYIYIYANLNLLLFIFLLYFLNRSFYKKLLNYQNLFEFLEIEEEQNFEEQNRILHKLLNSKNIDDLNFEVYTRTIPNTFLGGDFIYQQTDVNGKYWFAIGDSSGHDINSHLYSISILIRLAYLINRKGSPMEVHGWIDKSIEESIIENNLNISKYASLLLLSSDSTGKFTHFGQHPNLILFRNESGVCESIQTTGGFIGLTIPNASEEEYTFQMHRGDIVFAFTDGFFEQKNKEGKYFGTKLYDFIQNTNKDDLKDFTRKLYSEIKNFTKGHFNDDMSILIIKKK